MLIGEKIFPLFKWCSELKIDRNESSIHDCKVIAPYHIPKNARLRNEEIECVIFPMMDHSPCPKPVAKIPLPIPVKFVS